MDFGEDKERLLFQKKLRDLEKVVDRIPGSVIIHRLKEFRVEYMSPWGMKTLGVRPDEVIHLNAKEYHEKYFNPEDAADYVPKIKKLIEKGDENEIITFFQQVRSSEDEDWSWYLSTTKIFMKDKHGKPAYIITIASPVNPVQNITSKVNRLLEENNYLRQYNSVFAELTKREKEVLKHMALGKNSLEIAGELFISERTVETHRKKIRKKIKAKNNYDIVLFAQAFDLI